MDEDLLRCFLEIMPEIMRIDGCPLSVANSHTGVVDDIINRMCTNRSKRTVNIVLLKARMNRVLDLVQERLEAVRTSLREEVMSIFTRHKMNAVKKWRKNKGYELAYKQFATKMNILITIKDEELGLVEKSFKFFVENKKYFETQVKLKLNKH